MFVLISLLSRISLHKRDCRQTSTKNASYGATQNTDMPCVCLSLRVRGGITRFHELDFNWFHKWKNY